MPPGQGVLAPAEVAAANDARRKENVVEKSVVDVIDDDDRWAEFGLVAC
jgi:hypothetical protein